MSPKYWASSEDLSADSSAESSQSESRDHSVHGEVDGEDGGEPEVSELSTTEEISLENSDVGIVARTTGRDIILPRLPNLQPHQHASVFYLSLIEGRCRTQAAHTVNAGRNPENCVPEDHPEVLGLAQHLFAEMQRELVKAGMIPEEFAGPTLPELRQYLNSFDTLLSNIATQRTFNLAEQHSHRALRGFDSPFNSDIASNTSLFSYNSDPFIRRKSIMPPNSTQQLQRRPQPSQLSLLFPEVQDTTLNESIYASNYEQ
jgi:translation initiation factor 2-alpha kinase 3